MLVAGPVNSPHKGTKASDAEFDMFSLICAWVNEWINNGEAGDLRRHRAHYGVIVIIAADCLVQCLIWHWTAILHGFHDILLS